MVLPVLSRAFAGASAGAGLSLLKQIGAGDRPGHYRNFPNAFMRIAFVAGTYQPNRCGVAHYTACLRSHLTPGYRVGRLDDSGKRRCNCQSVVQGWQRQHLPALVQAICTSNIDLLHIQHAAGTYSFERAIFLLPLLRLRGWHQPIVTTVHEYGCGNGSPQAFHCACSNA